jgi:hypothetical protein
VFIAVDTGTPPLVVEASVSFPVLLDRVFDIGHDSMRWRRLVDGCPGARDVR